MGTSDGIKKQARDEAHLGSEATRRIPMARYDASATSEEADSVVTEEPLEIQVGSSPLAVVMRTPGHDEELAVGFLLTEQVVSTFTDIASVRHCTIISNPEAEDNVIRITLKSGVPFDPEKLQRNLFTSSSCGICGKASIDRVLKTAPPLEDESVFPAEYFYDLPDQLREAQTIFSETGGLHGAGLFDSTGRLLAAREDVGRHNAVDKVVGWALRDGRVPLTNHALMVSGRISFEIVQKGLAARIPVIAAVSAPSSLAIKLADEAGMTLIGFLRGSGMNVYSQLNRIKGSSGTSDE